MCQLAWPGVCQPEDHAVAGPSLGPRCCWSSLGQGVGLSSAAWRQVHGWGPHLVPPCSRHPRLVCCYEKRAPPGALRSSGPTPRACPRAHAPRPRAQGRTANAEQGPNQAPSEAPKPAGRGAPGNQTHPRPRQRGCRPPQLAPHARADPGKRCWPTARSALDRPDKRPSARLKRKVELLVRL